MMQKEDTISDLVKWKVGERASHLTHTQTSLFIAQRRKLRLQNDGGIKFYLPAHKTDDCLHRWFACSQDTHTFISPEASICIYYCWAYRQQRTIQIFIQRAALGWHSISRLAFACASRVWKVSSFYLFMPTKASYPPSAGPASHSCARSFGRKRRYENLIHGGSQNCRFTTLKEIRRSPKHTLIYIVKGRFRVWYC